MAQNAFERLLPAREFRSLTGMGTTKFYALLKSGDISAVKLGNRTLIPEREYRRFLESLPAMK